MTDPSDRGPYEKVTRGPDFFLVRLPHDPRILKGETGGNKGNTVKQISFKI